MAKVFQILVENDLKVEKREINIYHHSRTRTFILSPGNTISIPLNSVENFDYIYISIVKGPGNLQSECFVNFPAWADYELFANNFNGTLHCSRSCGKTFLQVPSGPPNFELKITMHDREMSLYPTIRDRIIFGNHSPVADN